MNAAPVNVDVMIQARVGSTRLPRKVMLPLGESTTLGTMIERVKRVSAARQVVILTTQLREDDEVADLAGAHGVAVFRGDTDDVLARYYHAAVLHDSEIVVRLTGDCPFMDPALIDDMLRVFLQSWPRIDMLTNCRRRTYARGLDVEVLSRTLLERLHEHCREAHDREHVVPYVEEHPEEFAVVEYHNAVDDSRSRPTLDTEKDYETIANVYGLFGHDRFSYDELIAAVRLHPQLLVNGSVVHKAYRA